MKRNPHLHAVFLDGVYVPGPDGTPEFRALPRLSTTDVADALQVARARILRYLERRRVITLDSEADSDVLCVSEELAERNPALAQLAAAAVSGPTPAGPELRRKPREIAFAGRSGLGPALCLTISASPSRDRGFGNLHVDGLGAAPSERDQATWS